jgi:hypothetical protein
MQKIPVLIAKSTVGTEASDEPECSGERFRGLGERFRGFGER